MSELIWDHERVLSVMAIRVRSMISPERLKDDELTTSALEPMFIEFKQAQGGIAAGVSREDMNLMDETVRTNAALSMTMRWMPKVTTVELRGGALDGSVLEYRDAPWSPLVMDEPEGDFQRNDDGLKVLPVHKSVWHMTGWHTLSRHWIYEKRN